MCDSPLAAQARGTGAFVMWSSMHDISPAGLPVTEPGVSCGPGALVPLACAGEATYLYPRTPASPWILDTSTADLPLSLGFASILLQHFRVWSTLG